MKIYISNNFWLILVAKLLVQVLGDSEYEGKLNAIYTLQLCRILYEMYLVVNDGGWTERIVISKQFIRIH